MADLDTTQLTATTTPADGDLLYTVVDPLVTPLDRKITWTSVKAFLKTYFDGLYPTSKATQAEVATGTDDTKYTTPLAVASYANQSLYRQAIINGNFDVWQRGVSFTAAPPIYTADRWYYYDNGASRTITRDTDVPNITSKYSFKNVLVAGGTNKQFNFYQRIEGATASKFSGKEITFSFWVKASVGAGTMSGNIAFEYPSAEDNFATNENAVNFNFTPTTSWTKITGTVTLPAVSVAGSSYPITNGIQIIGYIKASDNTTLTANIAQVQLCAGSVALPFQPKSFAEELRDCQRYCYGITTVSVTEEIAQGPAASTTVSYPSITLPVTMRTLPTVTATAGDWQLDDTINAPTDVTALVIDDLGFSNTRKVVLKASADSGLTAYRPYYLVGDGNAGRVLILSSEL